MEHWITLGVCLTKIIARRFGRIWRLVLEKFNGWNQTRVVRMTIYCITAVPQPLRNSLLCWQLLRSAQFGLHSVGGTERIFFKMGQQWPLFVYFWSFQTIFTTNQCDKMSCPSSIRHRDLNPWTVNMSRLPLDHGSRSEKRNFGLQILFKFVRRGDLKSYSTIFFLNLNFHQPFCQPLRAQF